MHVRSCFSQRTWQTRLTACWTTLPMTSTARCLSSRNRTIRVVSMPLTSGAVARPTTRPQHTDSRTTEPRSQHTNWTDLVQVVLLAITISNAKTIFPPCIPFLAMFPGAVVNFVLYSSLCTPFLWVLSSFPSSLTTTSTQPTLNLFTHFTFTHVQNALQLISSWMIADKLTRNSCKTKFLPSGFRKQLPEYTTPQLTRPLTLIATSASFRWTLRLLWPVFSSLFSAFVKHVLCMPRYWHC